MQRDEYIRTINYNGHMVNVGLDDAGQQFFLQYINEDGDLVETGCGAFNDCYMYEVERLFGSPKQCVSYGTGPCELYHAHGYCGQCPYNILRLERKIGRIGVDKNEND